MSDGGLLRLFSKPDFDVDRFVTKTIQNEDIANTLNKLSHLSTSVQERVQSMVFSNYQFFSKIGKLTTQVEAIMPQINSDFTEKQRVMNNLFELSLFNTGRTTYASVDDISPKTDESRLKTDASTVSMRSDHKADAKPSQYAGMSVSEMEEVVFGAMSLSGNPDRRVIFDGDLRELSTENLSLLQNVHIFLLTDCLVVTLDLRHLDQSSPHRYRLQTTYDLCNVAVSKLSGHDRRHTPQYTFRLKVTPASRLFQAYSREEKSVWIQKVNEAKAACRKTLRAPTVNSPDRLSVSSYGTVGEESVSRQDYDGDEGGADFLVAGQLPYALAPSKVPVEVLRNAVKALSTTLPECANLFTDVDTPGSTQIGRKNPFREEEVYFNQIRTDVDSHATDALACQVGDKSSTNWLWQVPDDLTVAIAERNFSHATNLVVQAVREIEIILASPNVPKVNAGVKPDKTVKHKGLIASEGLEAWEDLLSRVRLNEAHLIEALQYDLTTTSDCHGATCVVKANVVQLGQLGKVNLASQLFLVYRSNLLARSLSRGMRQEASQLVFFYRLSMIFHRQLVEAHVDWQQSVVRPLTALSDSDMAPINGRRRPVEHLFDLMFHSWLLEEAEKFGRRLYILFSDSRFMSFHIVTQASHRIRAHSEKITELLGVDIFPAMFPSLLRILRHTGEEQALFLRDAIINRYKTDTWEPVVGYPGKDHSQYALDLHDMGLLDSPCFTDASPPLTVGTYQSIRSLYQFVQSIRRLDCGETVYFIKLLCEIVETERSSYQTAMAELSDCSEQKEAEKMVIMRKNYEFFGRQVLPTLTEQLGVPCPPELNAILVSM